MLLSFQKIRQFPALKQNIYKPAMIIKNAVRFRITQSAILIEKGVTLVNILKDEQSTFAKKSS